MSEKFLLQRNLNVHKSYDVVVFGGGAAGFTAAVQAARAGARTALVEKNGILGGTTIVASVNFPGLFHTRQGKQVIAGIGWEAIKRTEYIGGTKLPDFNVPYSYEGVGHPQHHILVNRFVFSAVLDELCISAGVDIRFHETVAHLEQVGDEYHIALAGKSGLSAIRSRVVVDATGDGNIADMLGCQMERTERLQPGTIIYSLTGYDLEKVDKHTLRERSLRALEQGEVLLTDFPPYLNEDPPYWNVLRRGGGNCNHIPNIDAKDSEGKTKAELKGRASVMRTYQLLRTIPGCEKLQVTELANECGIRDTQRIIGEQRITGDKYRTGYLWKDAVCYSYYPIDLHNSEDNTLYCEPLQEDVFPTISYGALIPKGSHGIIAAGRCISGDAEAHSAYRVQASAMAIGQAAGAAAALAAQLDCSLQNVNLERLRNLLREHEAIVPDALS